MGDPPIVAVEGPSDSGKSTLARALSEVPEWQPVTLLPCYADLAGASVPPPFADTREEQIESFRSFVAIDHKRREEAYLEEARLIVADRSWLSLLAHPFAVDQEASLGAYEQCRTEILADEARLDPDLVLLLCVSDEARTSRMAAEDRGEWFTKDSFNAAFAAFFAEEAAECGVTVVTLDADRPISEVADAAINAIESRALLDG